MKLTEKRRVKMLWKTSMILFFVLFFISTFLTIAICAYVAIFDPSTPETDLPLCGKISLFTTLVSLSYFVIFGSLGHLLGFLDEE